MSLKHRIASLEGKMAVARKAFSPMVGVIISSREELRELQARLPSTRPNGIGDISLDLLRGDDPITATELLRRLSEYEGLTESTVTA
jgi:hypothetical protein